MTNDHTFSNLHFEAMKIGHQPNRGQQKRHGYSPSPLTSPGMMFQVGVFRRRANIGSGINSTKIVQFIYSERDGRSLEEETSRAVPCYIYIYSTALKASTP